MEASHFSFLGENRTLRRHTSPQKRMELSQAYRDYRKAEMRVRRPKTQQEQIYTISSIHTPHTKEHATHKIKGNRVKKDKGGALNISLKCAHAIHRIKGTLYIIYTL